MKPLCDFCFCQTKNLKKDPLLVLETLTLNDALKKPKLKCELEHMEVLKKAQLIHSSAMLKLKVAQLWTLSMNFPQDVGCWYQWALTAGAVGPDSGSMCHTCSARIWGRHHALGILSLARSCPGWNQTTRGHRDLASLHNGTALSSVFPSQRLKKIV